LNIFQLQKITIIENACVVELVEETEGLMDIIGQGTPAIGDPSFYPYPLLFGQGSPSHNLPVIALPPLFGQGITGNPDPDIVL
jgi:hypothetical protein